MSKNIIHPIEWYISENKRLKQENDELHDMLKLSAGVSLKLIDEFLREKLK